MTPNQRDNPNDPRGGQPSGQRPPRQPPEPPRQPQRGVNQGQPPAQGPQPQPRQGPPGAVAGHQQAGAPQAGPGTQPVAPQGTPRPQGQPAQPSGQRQFGGQPPQTGARGQRPPARGDQPQGQQAGPAGGFAGGPPQAGHTPASLGGRTAPGRDRLRPVTVDDIVTADVVTAARDTPVRTVVAKMAERNVGSVVVVEDDEPVGVVTDRRVALALEATPELAGREAGELIESDAVAVDPSMTVLEALQLMSDEAVRRLPVVDEDGELTGIITLDDAIVLLADELATVAETIRSQSPRR